MKCLYFLAPTLASTHDVSDDLHEVGIEDFYLHVISKDESGLKKQHIHSSNYLETLDVVRDGFIGAALGFVVGLIGIALLMYFEPFGAERQVPTFVYVILVGVATLFGAWEGGLTGIATENKKLDALPRRHRSRQVSDPRLRAQASGGSGAQDDEASVIPMRSWSRSIRTSSIRSARRARVKDDARRRTKTV